MPDNTRPFQTGKAPSEEQMQAFARLTSMLKGGQQEYIPVIKSLSIIGIEAKQMTVMIGDEPTDCIVIPVDELMQKEWLHMSGRKTTPQREETRED